MSNGPTPGAVLPDFELPDDQGTTRRLSQLQGTGAWWTFLADAGLQDLFRHTKPDLDPTVPEVRTAWEQANTPARQPGHG